MSMNIIKSFKLFESKSESGKYKYWKERTNRVMNKIYSAKIGDFLSEDDIYPYVEILHGNDDFIDGNLGERIEEYDTYKLVEVDIDELNIDEYFLFDELVDTYVDKYKKSREYPPIVIDSSNRLIDGNHRSNALNKLGFKKIKAFKGVN